MGLEKIQKNILKATHNLEFLAVLVFPDSSITLDIHMSNLDICVFKLDIFVSIPSMLVLCKTWPEFRLFKNVQNVTQIVLFLYWAKMTANWLVVSQVQVWEQFSSKLRFLTVRAVVTETLYLSSPIHHPTQPPNQQPINFMKSFEFHIESQPLICRLNRPALYQTLTQLLLLNLWARLECNIYFSFILITSKR